MGELNYTTINHTARKKLSISLNDYAVADLVYQLSNNPESDNPGWCYASKDYLAETLDLSRATVFRSIELLLSLNLLEKNKKNHYLKTTVLWYKSVILNDSLKMRRSQSQNETVQAGDSLKMRLNNNIYNNINNINNINNKTDKQLNSKTVCVSTKKCGNCAKCSVVACSPLQLWEMAMNENIWINDVKQKHDDILRMSETGELKKYKVKTMIGTLRTWIRLGVKKGYIREMDDIQRLLMPDEHPDIKEKIKQSILIARQKGLI